MLRKINWNEIKTVDFKIFMKLRSYEEIDLHFQLWNMTVFWIITNTFNILKWQN